MRIAACVAAVPNPDNVKWDRFRQLLDVQDAEPVLNPIDRHALELAAGLAKQTASTFDAICVGSGASAALREAAVFGANRLIAVTDEALEAADEAGIAAALAATLRHVGGADIVLCGGSAAAYGSGAVPGYLSAELDARLLTDALAIEVLDGAPTATLLGSDLLWKMPLNVPVVLTAAPFGIKVRAVSPLLLMKAAKRPIESLTLSDVGCDVPVPSSGAVDGQFESTHGKKGMEIVEGPDALTRAITLVAALRDRQAV
jgi:electron transfer flavoprotein beta subunit